MRYYYSKWGGIIPNILLSIAHPVLRPFCADQQDIWKNVILQHLSPDWCKHQLQTEQNWKTACVCYMAILLILLDDLG